MTNEPSFDEKNHELSRELSVRGGEDQDAPRKEHWKKLMREMVAE